MEMKTINLPQFVCFAPPGMPGFRRSQKKAGVVEYLKVSNHAGLLFIGPPADGTGCPLVSLPTGSTQFVAVQENVLVIPVVMIVEVLTSIASAIIRWSLSDARKMMKTQENLG